MGSPKIDPVEISTGVEISKYCQKPIKGTIGSSGLNLPHLTLRKFAWGRKNVKIATFTKNAYFFQVLFLLPLLRFLCC